MAQPIIRGVQAIGSVSIRYKYLSTQNILYIPDGFTFGDSPGGSIDTSAGIEIAGFRLDSEFIRAAQQIATSYTIPLLGGGGVSLTNNNRSGTLTINSTRVSSPHTSGETGSMANLADSEKAYDIVLLAQCQQAAAGGDSFGAEIQVIFDFAGKGTIITFDTCTVADVAPLALAGNDTPNYNVVFNYLNWSATFKDSLAAT
jgi:hypothetical protein